MDSRLRFRPRLVDDEPPGDPGTKLPRSCGSTVSWCRVATPEARDETGGATQWSRVVESAGKKSLGGSQRGVRTVNRHR
jgi:hypothetical protein